MKTIVDYATLEKNYVDGQDQNIYASNNILGSKNVSPMDIDIIKTSNGNGTWSDNVFSYNGGTVTVDVENGSITVDGTFSASFDFQIYNRITNNIRIQTGEWILSNGGNTNVTLTVIGTRNGAYNLYASSTGADAAFEILSTDGNTGLAINIQPTTYTNEVVYPMIRPSTYQNATFQPYAMTNRELTSQISNLTSNMIKSKTGISVTTDSVGAFTLQTADIGFNRERIIDIKIGQGGGIYFLLRGRAYEGLLVRYDMTVMANTTVTIDLIYY